MASNTFKMVDFGAPAVPSKINWEKCIICQAHTAAKLRCPSSSEDATTNVDIKSIESGYTNIADSLLAFEAVGELSNTIKMSQMNNGSGIAATLSQNKAVFHDLCRLKYNKTELGRINKRKLLEKENDNCSKRKHLERKLPNKDVCFFCDKPGTSCSTLHRAMTKEIGDKVRLCAIEASNDEILAKVGSGDFVADDVQYHNKCLVNLYNSARNAYKKSSKTSIDLDVLTAQAFAELLSFIDGHISECTSTNITPIFKLCDLVRLYKCRLEQLGGTASSAREHSTRIKERILGHFPELSASQSGREVLLVMSDKVGTAMRTACERDAEDEACILARAAAIVRKQMLAQKCSFTGKFSDNCQAESVPGLLQTMMNMVMHGPSITAQAKMTPIQYQKSVTVGQLIVFNSSSRTDAESKFLRHNRQREPPLPVYLGTLVHTKTRKKELIDIMFELGLSISYDRVLQISTELGNKISHWYHEMNAVCPPQLKNFLFTTGAVDNIDHQTSSTSAQASFHGTGISLFQHTTTENSGVDRNIVAVTSGQQTHVSGKERCKMFQLPMSYSSVPPISATNMSTSVPQLESNSNVNYVPTMNTFSNSEKNWLDHVEDARNSNTEAQQSVSWAAFHAFKQPTADNINPCTSALLPLFYDEAASVSMIRHSMDVIKTAVEILNPGQIPVITGDQPLYALAKQIQWTWPATHGEQHFVVMMGGLHIEMAALSVIGDLLKSSGWTGILVLAGVTTSGTADSFLKVSHVTRTRRSHQVTACALYHCLRESFKDYTGGLDFHDWCDDKTQVPQFKFWYMILRLQLTVLSFIRSLRIGDFELYVETLKSLVGWFFALDHTNYARYISVHIRDMVNLEFTHPAIFTEFTENAGFVIKKTSKKFSKIAIDQAHEQNNATVKADGGAVGLTENPAALRRWMVAGPEMARMINEFEKSTKAATIHHHEQTDAVQTSFLKDVNSLALVIDQCGNPFLEEGPHLLTLDTRDIADDIVVQNLLRIEELGWNQYEMFVKERLTDCSKPLSIPINRNNLKIFSESSSRKRSKTQDQILALKDDCSLFSQLYVACQVRDGNLQEFFNHENQAYPPSLASNGGLRAGAKANIVACLKNNLQPVAADIARPQADVMIIDGAVAVNMLKPRVSATFGEYRVNEFEQYILSQLSHVKRLDIVWDEYKPNSLKQHARQRRGTGSRRRVEASTPLPKNWHEFLRCDGNKMELFAFLSDVTHLNNEEKQIISNTQDCTHEEADTRMMVHVADATKGGYKNVTIRTVDSDVVVLAVVTFHLLTPSLDTLWVAFGTGKNFENIPAHEIAQSMGPNKCKALPFFHAFTGCDTVSCFDGRGKKCAWDTWTALPEATETFALLSNTPSISDVERVMPAVERYTIMLYDRNNSNININEARRQLFAKGRQISHIPPTYGALLEHTKRAALQGGHYWGLTNLVTSAPDLPHPEGWGWIMRGTSWDIMWTKLPQASKACRELVKCGCLKGCKDNTCTCKRHNLKCTELCKCLCL